MTITAKKRQPLKSKLYVHYDELTREILSIGRYINPDVRYYFITDDVIALKITQGVLSHSDYRVEFDEDDNAGLVATHPVGVSFRQSKKLSVIPNIKLRDWNIRALLYHNDSKLVFEINEKTTKSNQAAHMVRELQYRQLGFFDFYIVDKNRPDYLYQSIRINVNELFLYNKVSVDIHNLKNYIQISDIGLLSSYQFSKYYFEVIGSSDQPIDSENISSKVKRVTTLSEADIELVQNTDNELLVSATTELLTSSKRSIPLYIVKDTPDHVIGSFDIDIDRLKAGDSMKYRTDFDLDDVDIIHNEPSLKIGKRKE